MTPLHTLYTVGYQGLKVDELKATAEKLGAMLADVRYSPRSRDPNWSGKRLAEALGDRYCHLQSLGNRNYKGSGGEIELEDIDQGTLAVKLLLEKQPVILMCACWNLQECHRKVVSEIIAQRLGCEVTHLWRADVKAYTPAAPAEPDPQPPLPF